MNPVVYAVLVIIGLALESAVATALLIFGAGTPRFAALFAAFLSIGAWTVGMYYFVSSVMIRVGFVTDGSDAVFPSLLTLFPTTQDMFARGALACVNICWLAAIPLHAIALTAIDDLAKGRAYALAAFLAFGEIALSGTLSKVLG